MLKKVARKNVRRPRRRGGFRRRRGFRPVRSVADYAGMSVTRTLQAGGPGGNFTANTMYHLNNIILADYERAVQVAVAYQHFRIKKVTLIVKPSFDTYQQAAGNPGKQRLYFMIDKADSIPANAQLETLKSAGAKPLNFDEKPIKISWRPSVLTTNRTIVGVPIDTQYKISPWLATNTESDTPFTPNVVPHKGVWFYVDQVFGGALATQYQVEMTVEFQFKKPIWVASPGAAVAQIPFVAPLDASKDGVVGGNDHAE